VLLSIQSLILVPEPFFNEPGYEARHTGEEGKRLSREYNKDITEGTIRYAMIDLLQVCIDRRVLLDGLLAIRTERRTSK